jgi:Lysine methyltransferase
VPRFAVLHSFEVMSFAATRESLDAFESYLTYFPFCDAPGLRDSLIIKESTHMVDGIGGGTWEGAILMSKLLEAINVDCNHQVVELGCGAGLSGIVAALRGSRTEISDRVVDLATENIAYCRDQLETGPYNLFDNGAINSAKGTKFDICAYEISWGLEDNAESTTDHPDLILGAEITCLRKQQPDLMKTIEVLAGPKTLILLSFDDLPMPISMPTSGTNRSEREGSDVANGRCPVDAVSMYEREFDGRMQAAGFNRAVVCTAAVDWFKENVREGSAISARSSSERNPVQLTVGHSSSNCDIGGANTDAQNQTKALKKSHAVVSDLTSQHYYNHDIVSFPSLFNVSGNKNGPYGKPPLCVDLSDDAAHPAQQHQPFLAISHHVHHITAYYRPTAVSICTRCHKSYIIVLGKDKVRWRKAEGESEKSSADTDECGFCD